MSPDVLSTAAEDLAVLGQAALALLLGGAIGLEREASRKWAGLRTNMLVCLAALLFTRVGLMATEYASLTLAADLVEADPVRIIQAVAVGISFLGAGLVIRDPEENRVRGLTTAATLLTVAPIGIAVAIGHYVLAVGVTLLVLLVLRGVSLLEARFFPEP